MAAFWAPCAVERDEEYADLVHGPEELVIFLASWMSYGGFEGIFTLFDALGVCTRAAQSVKDSRSRGASKHGPLPVAHYHCPVTTPPLCRACAQMSSSTTTPAAFTARTSRLTASVHRRPRARERTAPPYGGCVCSSEGSLTNCMWLSCSDPYAFHSKDVGKVVAAGSGWSWKRGCQR